MPPAIVEHCSSYVYLGCHFTCDGSVSAALKLHAQNKLCQVSKFVSIIRKNNDVPFIVKKRLFDAAQISALLCGCESWVGADVKSIIKLVYERAIGSEASNGKQCLLCQTWVFLLA